ncbi:transcriptional regulator [Collibacillus ludicampi]|uniref:Transcriptional regulator n=1 Tax=Collibacillus ludicampi TaxID=2771369 RepID=A0AAV4LIN5_9BACL|nr:FMN-binding negative transcriptional regulator [Collibacillus ludicampi]GIM47732.1 transcriptional regulator [Collibacillus ludicampi]
MYIPKAFEVNEKRKLVNFIKDNSFGILFTQNENGPFATHLPFLIDESKYDNGVLMSHMAKANPHWKDLGDKEVLVVFSGPHAYISPSWYGEFNTVPTWNYVAVHVYGEFKVIDDKEEAKKIIEDTVNFYESSLPNPWLVNFEDKFINELMNGLVTFEIKINKVEGKWKLSQNHSIQRQQNLVNGLLSSNKYNSLEIAKLIEENIRLDAHSKE